MKVVHLIASSGLYGAEKWILAMMRAMASSQTESVLVNLTDTDGFPSAVVSAARERKLVAHDFYTGGTFNPLSVFKFSRWLKTNRVEIVHGHGYKSDFIGLISARMAGCKIISTPHGWSKEADKKLQFYEWLDRFLFRFMDYVCPLSADLLASVQHCTHSDKLKLILNGVDIEEVFAASAYKKKSDDRFRIGYVGQLIERKDISTLLKAFSILVKNEQKIQLIIVGDGPEKQCLEALSAELNIGDHVEFTGYRTDAVSLLKSFDVFVLPSRLEGIPRCIMEAMAAKVPVIVSDIPGNRDLVVHGVTGLLYPLLDEQGLAEALLSLLDNYKSRVTFSDNAYDLILQKYSNQRMALEYALVYSQFQNV
jgi:glycosyltransferase involved in cell wall biosynthesis